MFHEAAKEIFLEHDHRIEEINGKPLTGRLPTK
jgi:hypothetical protein